MNTSLSLLLESFEQSVECLRFHVSFFNRGADRLFFPTPKITGLCFQNAADGQEAQWFTNMVVAKRDNGFELGTGAARVFEWRVRPRGIAFPVAEKFSDYGRWCVDIPAGTYHVTYHFEVQPEYYDPDSQSRLPELEQMARTKYAALWQGQAKSNSVTVLRQS